LEESFVKYLARILDQSAISPDQLTDLRLLEYDPQTHENYPEDVSPKRYYILRGFFFAKVHTGSDSSGPGPFHTRSTAHSIGPCYNRRRVDWDHSKWCNCTLTGASSPFQFVFLFRQ
jgi:hypothetical protein